MVWERVGDSSCNRRLDLSSGSVGGVVARHLFDEMPDHQDATTGGVLRITVSHVLYPVTKEVLHQILEGYGVEKMSVFERVNHVEAMVQLRSWQEAKQARDAFHGRCIYEGCCFLDILLEPPRPDSASTTTARRDAEASAIAPEVVVADACSSPSDKQAEPWPEEPKQQQPAESQSQETRNQNDEPSKPNEPAEKPGPDNAEASAAEPSSPQPSPEPKKSADETPKPVQESREASNAKANADANANGNTSDETKAATGQQSNEAKGLLLASIRDPNPVIFFEPNGCTVCLLREVPEEDYMLPLSQAEVIRKGGDITLIGWGAQLVVLELACEDAAKDGSSCELIYLKTLIPWDKEIVEASVSKTGKLLVSHEASITGGFGAEPTSLLLKILSGHALQRPWDPGGQDIAIASVRGIKTKDSAVVAHNSEFYIEIKNLNTVSVQQSVVGNEIPVEIPGLAEPKVSLKLDSPDECSVNVESNNTDMVDSKSDKTSSYGELIGDLNASSLRKCSPFISDQESQSTCSRKVECFMEDSMDALHIMSKVSPSPEVVGSDNVESETVINSNTKFALIGNELKIIHTENTTRECTSQNWPVLSKASRRVEAVTDSRKESADAAPVIVPRTTSRMEMASDSRREPSAGRVLSPFRVQSRYTELRKLTNGKVDTDKVDAGSKNTETNDFTRQIFLPRRNGVIQTENSEETREDVKHGTVDRLGFSSSAEPNISHRSENYVSRIRKPRDNCYIEVSRAGRARSVVSNWEGRDQSPSDEEPTTSNYASVAPRGRLYSSRGSNQAAETPTIVSDEDVLSVLMEQHDLFLSSTRSRLTKLQIVHQMWERNDIRGVITAMEKMSDHAVSADMASVLMEKSETITLDLCTSILPVLTDLLESKTDRHLGVSLELLVKLVRTFGPVIQSTVSAGPSSVGVDLQAEQRRERCNRCFIELEKVKNKLPFLTRRKGAVANTAQELSLAFQEVM